MNRKKSQRKAEKAKTKRMLVASATARYNRAILNHAFVDGIKDIFAIYPSPYEIKLKTPLDDSLSLSSDWRKVGSEIRQAMTRL